MHVRLTLCIGMPILDDRTGEAFAVVTGAFVHPDTGVIEGLFVRSDEGDTFLASSDIAHWGKHVVVRNDEVLAPLEDRVRLSALWNEGRSVLGQPMVTESGRSLGTCRDVQFETETFRVEWLFPRRWFRWGNPVPIAAVVEVRPDGVRIRETDVAVSVQEEVVPGLESIATPTPVQG